jgi:hypothetical protein
MAKSYKSKRHQSKKRHSKKRSLKKRSVKRHSKKRSMKKRSHGKGWRKSPRHEIISRGTPACLAAENSSYNKHKYRERHEYNVKKCCEEDLESRWCDQGGFLTKIKKAAARSFGAI